MKRKLIICLLALSVSLFAKIPEQKTEVEILRDSITLLKAEKPKMSVSEFEAKYKLARIERYIKICEKRPANKKYFFGWVKRTIKN